MHADCVTCQKTPTALFSVISVLRRLYLVNLFSIGMGYVFINLLKKNNWKERGYWIDWTSNNTNKEALMFSPMTMPVVCFVLFF